MDRERRTRQSNREYQQRIRQERYREEQRQDGYFSVIPKSTQELQDRSVHSDRTNQRREMQAGIRRQDARHKHSERYSQREKVRDRGNQEPRMESSRQPSQSRNRKNQAGNVQKSRQSSSIGLDRRRTQLSSRELEDIRKAGERTAAKQVYFDYTLVFIVVFLVLYGLLMLYTASIYTSSYFVKQCVISLGGMVVMYIFSKIDYHIYANKKVLILIVVGALLSILLLFTPFGITRNGSTRWIGIRGLSVQPAEFWKIGIILVNAAFINRFSKRMQQKEIIGLFVFITISSFLIILGPADNLSSAIIVAMITVLMVFVAYPTYKPFFILGGLGLAVAGIFVYMCLTFENFAQFRGARIIAWLQPDKAGNSDMTFQSVQALYSIGSGGLSGKGLGSGTQKMILPEAMNDMIFAIICEEMGMIGAFIVLVMFAVLLYRLMFIAKNSKDLHGGMIATGVFVHFMVQVVLNIGVVTGLLPSTGVTLPFISYGGTALVLLLAEVGIALNVSRHIDFEQRLVRKRVKKQQRHR